jgi:hypothetical protein
VLLAFLNLPVFESFAQVIDHSAGITLSSILWRAEDGSYTVADHIFHNAILCHESFLPEGLAAS